MVLHLQPEKQRRLLSGTLIESCFFSVFSFGKKISEKACGIEKRSYICSPLATIKKVRDGTFIWKLFESKKYFRKKVSKNIAS